MMDLSRTYQQAPLNNQRAFCFGNKKNIMSTPPPQHPHKML